jgi:hypothetical protein
MKSTITCLLILSFVIPASARERTPEEQAKKIRRGSRVVVTLKDKQTLKGRLGELRQDRFMLEPDVPGTSSNRELLFQDIRKIGRVKEKLTLKDALLLPVAVVALSPLLVYCGILKNNCNPSP